MTFRSNFQIYLVVFVALLLGSAIPTRAHCDTLDGPVVKAAEKALDTGDVNLVLIWVRPSDEPEIRAAFARTSAVRRLNAEARTLADRHFFETLVRIHRAGEGMPFTGLKHAGTDLGPAIPAADRALEKGSSEEVEKLLQQSLIAGIQHRFRAARARAAYPSHDVAAGRQFVEAYVEFLHYIEAAYGALSGEKPASHTEQSHNR